MRLVRRALRAGILAVARGVGPSFRTLHTERGSARSLDGGARAGDAMRLHNGGHADECRDMALMPGEPCPLPCRICSPRAWRQEQDARRAALRHTNRRILPGAPQWIGG
jgi:hypothetical protein